jgi:hypothetical protein
MIRSLLRSLILPGTFLSAVTAVAQNVPILMVHQLAVGAITRDAGLYTGPADMATMKGVNRYLVLLESDLASKVSSMHNVSYQDRTATAELLHEVHMSSGRDFDPTSGALRGLMGRLDFLIVIDAIDPSTAKMRLIDVESGSIKGIETCSKRVSDNSACIVAMVHRIEAAARDRAGANEQLAAAREDMMKVKPAWDEAVGRYDADKAFWERIEGTISSGGHALRPEIRSLLNGAQKDVQTGSYAIQTLDTQTLQGALTTLTAKLDKLDQYR